MNICSKCGKNSVYNLCCRCRQKDLLKSPHREKGLDIRDLMQKKIKDDKHLDFYNVAKEGL